MQFIDESEDYEGVELFDYQLMFDNISDDQQEYLIGHFDNYSWDMGLAISEGFVETDGSKTVFKFNTPKSFALKDESEWTGNDLENNLLTRLVGKEQFFSNMFFDEMGMEDIEITFISGADKYKVELSKYSTMEKI